MIKEEILSGNKLIDEFLNCTIYDYHDFLDNAYAQKLKYHSSWDWLMPVFQKIIADRFLIKSGNIISITPYINACRHMKNGAIKFDIEMVYNGVLYFINWYKYVRDLERIYNLQQNKDV